MIKTEFTLQIFHIAVAGGKSASGGVGLAFAIPERKGGVSKVFQKVFQMAFHLPLETGQMKHPDLEAYMHQRFGGIGKVFHLAFHLAFQMALHLKRNTLRSPRAVYSTFTYPSDILF